MSDKEWLAEKVLAHLRGEFESSDPVRFEEAHQALRANLTYGFGNWSRMGGRIIPLGPRRITIKRTPV